MVTTASRRGAILLQQGTSASVGLGRCRPGSPLSQRYGDLETYIHVSASELQPQRDIWWWTVMLTRTAAALCAAVCKRLRREVGACSAWKGALSTQHERLASSSSTRWKTRQGNDAYARDAKVAGLKSRAAFKLLEMNAKHRLFRKGGTVVDLGFAPGSWSQVAVNKTSPGGRVVGIDIMPAQPPRGANALQGNFLSAEIRDEVRKFVSDRSRGRVRRKNIVDEEVTEEDLRDENRGIIELERYAAIQEESNIQDVPRENMSQEQLDRVEGRVVDVVLSDMCEPWPLVASTWVRSVSNPYRRLMNTSGIMARDHGGSMVSVACATFAS